MSVEVRCKKDHTATGGALPGAVVGTFDSMQEACNRGLEESYPLCDFEYFEVPA